VVLRHDQEILGCPVYVNTHASHNAPMTTLRYFQLDVFAAEPGQGNPLGVVIGADDWATDTMQAFANWTGLVETTFLLPPSPGADYRVRIFTPTREIPFAGHPSLGSAHAALESGFSSLHDGALVQECGAGLLHVRSEHIDGRTCLFVQSPAARAIREGDFADAALRGLLGHCTRGALAPALIEGGRRWWIAELHDEAAVRGYVPDHAAIAALARADEALGLCLFARCSGQDYDLVVRAFPAGVGIDEDPASGAANGLIAGYIALREPQGALARGYRVSQGREIGHDAQISVKIDDGGAVWVGGPTCTVIRGELNWARGSA
jgi:PhzF family phenazine biosynthesis protein